MSEQLWAVREKDGSYLSERYDGGPVPLLYARMPVFPRSSVTAVPVTLIETAELDALRAEVERLRAALAGARDYIARDIEEILYSACRLDPVTGHPRRETIDPDSACFVEDAERVIAACDAALKGGEG